MAELRTAAIVTVGSELTQGLRIDTNTAEIARELSRRGFEVAETLSIGDDAELLAASLARLVALHALVVTTGGLGPTHDDITREAAARALGIALSTDGDIVERLRDVQTRHADPAAREAVLTQALVLDGAKIIHATTGTAPGQLVPTPAGKLVLLPGPPSEMRPMLLSSLEAFAETRAVPAELGVTGMSESDVQHAAQRALAGYEGIVLTVLAKPGDVRVLLLDDGAGESAIASAAAAVATEIGEACYTTSGETLAQSLLAEFDARDLTLATAESCTGGLVSAAITDVPGSSEVFLGGVVSYANQMKMDALGVPPGLLAQYGAVSEQTARAMAEGVRELSGADIAVSVTGVAGPGGGTASKPVGLVWFAVAEANGSVAAMRNFARGGRDSIRARAASTALDLLRRAARAR
jgi:nicotinamide-nucleotide amidase